MSQQVFITGTGTDVGKTVVAAALATGLARQRQRVTYWKPVQCGTETTDANFLRETVVNEFFSVAPSTFIFEQPLSPDQAAHRDQKVAPTVHSVAAALSSIAASDFLLMEGAGGIAVPLNEAGETWFDVCENLNVPCLVVAHSGLGTLNHTTLTLEGLTHRGIDVLGVVLSGPRHDGNLHSLARKFPKVPFHSLPHLLALDSNDQNWLNASDALANFLQQSLVLRMQQRLQTKQLTQSRDHKYVWHPYTQHRTAKSPLIVTRAKGVWLETADGQKILDGISSWWVNNIGHGRREIADAIVAQQARLDHVIFAGATHKGAAELAAALSHQLNSPGDTDQLTRAFYSDNGSTAVEVGLKIAFQYWRNRGDTNRNLFLSCRGSYHGDTFGTMAVAAAEEFHSAFAPLFFKAAQVTPATVHQSTHCPRGSQDFSERIRELHETIEHHHKNLAAVIVEPMLQGAGGMLVQDVRWLEELGDLCRSHNLPLIFDEVFTGFGRTGQMFAFQHSRIKPDIICLAKGLTGGTLPLAVTMCQEKYFETFLADDKSKAFLHGHSFTANPIGCAAALAALDIVAREDLAQRARSLELKFQSWLTKAKGEFGFSNPRCLGGMLAFELPDANSSRSYFDNRGDRVAQLALTENLLLRPLGNTVYFLPPLTIQSNETDLALGAIEKSLKNLSQL